MDKLLNEKILVENSSCTFSMFKYGFSSEEMEWKSFASEQGCLGRRRGRLSWKWSQRTTSLLRKLVSYEVWVLNKSLGYEGKQEVGITFQVKQTLNLENSSCSLNTQNERQKKGWQRMIKMLPIHLCPHGVKRSVFSRLFIPITTAKKKK